MQGKIVKGIAGFYYVHVVEFGLYECKAKGVFRKEKSRPLGRLFVEAFSEPAESDGSFPDELQTDQKDQNRKQNHKQSRFALFGDFGTKLSADDGSGTDHQGRSPNDVSEQGMT